MEVCYSCHRPIQGTSLIAINRHYHQTCFRCSVCHVQLHGSFLVGTNGEPVCTNCKTSVDASSGSAAVCFGCKGPISGTILTAMGQKYHPNCFKCNNCGGQLTGPFNLLDQKPVCEKCHDLKQKGGSSSGTQVVQHHTVQSGGSENGCGKCNGPILDGPIVTALNRKFHKDCFRCSNCNKQITGGFNSPDNHNPFCLDCYTINFGKKCHNCNLPIADQEYTVFDGKNYHHSCFRCTVCGKSLVGQPLGVTSAGAVCCVVHTR